MQKWKSAASGWISRIQDFKQEKNVAPKKEKLGAMDILINRQING